MSKFAQREGFVERLNRSDGAVLNYERGLAFLHGARSTLVSMALNSLVGERWFYGDSTHTVDDLVRYCCCNWPVWTVKLAVYLRGELFLRSISQRVLALCSLEPACRPHLTKAFRRVINRPDDALELAALLKDSRHGLAGSMPNVLKRLLGEYLSGLSEYHAIKYRRPRQFGLKHLVQLVHPTAGSEQQNLILRYVLDPGSFQKFTDREKNLVPKITAFETFKHLDRRCRRDIEKLIATGSIPWEMAVPRLGTSCRTWRTVAPTLPIMALLRNLRNLCLSGALKNREVKNSVIQKLTNPKVIEASKQLPFRWLSAYRAIKEIDLEVANSLITAVNLSVVNLPSIDGSAALFCDNSGSMSMTTISRHSSMLPCDIANLMGSMASRLFQHARTYSFAETVGEVPISLHDSIMTNYARIANTPVGCATYCYRCFETLRENRIKVDTVLIFTDMEVYGEDYGDSNNFNYHLKLYRDLINPDVHTYIFNLAPYRYFMTPKDSSNVTIFSGWNSNILRYIKHTREKSTDYLVKQIDKITL